MKTNAMLAVVRGLFYGGCHGDNEQEVFAELCRIVEETVELYQQDGRPLPSAASEKNHSNTSKPFHEKLTNLLKIDRRFTDNEGELVKAAVIDRAWKIDHDLVKMLLGDVDIKAKFFNEIEGHWIFNTNIFIEYISNKNFLANSYTRFHNKIGLNVGDKFSA